MPPPDFGATGGSGGTGGSGVSPLDPNTLHIVIGTSGASCSAPRDVSACGEWLVHIPLAPELQQEGTIRLGSVYAFFSEGDAPRSSDPFDCAMGAGSFADGSLVITAIDEHRISFTLRDTWMFGADANGTYQVERCGAP